MKTKFVISIGIFVLLSLVDQLMATTIYVNNLKGNNSFDGKTIEKPLKTIAVAVRLAIAGDTIQLINSGIPYKESLVLHDVHGHADAPIVIEGNNSIISGTENVNISEWEAVSNSLYKNTTIYDVRKFNMDVIARFFFLFNGNINRMGRCLKGKNVPLKMPEQLNENEWTFIESEKAFYIRLSHKPDQIDIQMPVRSNGVAINGSTRNLTIKNLICTHMYNDGFGITNTAKSLKFYNIQSLYCGDDGISAHADAEFTVDGFVSEGNGTGICDTGNTITSYNNVTIRNCVGVDLYFINERAGGAEHIINNSTIYANANTGVSFRSENIDGNMNVWMNNVTILNCGRNERGFRTSGGVTIEMKNCVFRD